MKHPDGRATAVPIHTGEIIGPGLLRAILRDAKLSAEEFGELL
jgi:predicted RNA binding protein YcfA (HicA-like mRNA interferase family)